MKSGDLVRIARESIGVPRGTVGLITKVESSSTMEKLTYYSVLIRVNSKSVERRYLREDLRII